MILLIIFTSFIIIWGFVLSYKLDKQKASNEYLKQAVKDLGEAHQETFSKFSRFINKNDLAGKYSDYLTEGEDE